MVAILAILLGFSLKVSQHTTTFYVESVSVYSKYDSNYALTVARMIVPPDREVSMTDVRCLESQLRRSGLFDVVRAEIQITGENRRRITLYCVARRELRGFVIGRIETVGFKELDTTKLMKALSARGVRVGIPLYEFPYDPLSEKVDEAINEALSDGNTSTSNKWAWISFAPGGKRRVNLVISENPWRCLEGSLSAQHKQASNRSL